MKIPLPDDGCYYIQQLYEYGWDLTICDFNYRDIRDIETARECLTSIRSNRDIETARECLTSIRSNNSEKTYRLVLAHVTVSYVTVNEG